jgi:superfamily II DNA/RNA helicase
VELLKRGDMPQALVFTRTKHRANRLASQLVTNGIKAERIHGNRSQSQRTQALAGFKDGAYQVLVATDIAARGIDVESLGHVVNFDGRWRARTTSTASAAPAARNRRAKPSRLSSPRKRRISRTSNARSGSSCRA